MCNKGGVPRQIAAGVLEQSMVTGWILETVAADRSRIAYEIASWPYRIGRDVDNDLAVASGNLSRHHAEITADGPGRLRLTDLGSTNGTFVNHERIQGTCEIGENDIVHFAQIEFRIVRHARPGEDDPDTHYPISATVLVPPDRGLTHKFLRDEQPFRELLAGRGIGCAVQPIVHVRSREALAYELLGRGEHPALPVSPMRLFEVAATLGREAELSSAFRVHGVRAAGPRVGSAMVFVNTHPSETFGSHFLDELRALRAQQPALPLVVEVHETAVVETDRMRELAAHLADMDVRFAYDDFGAGQARLNELGEVPAHFVKFDMGLIHDLDRASERKQRVVAEMVRLVHELGSVALAEGVETEAEAQLCDQMHFDLLQGYLTGRPMPVSQL